MFNTSHTFATTGSINRRLLVASSADIINYQDVYCHHYHNIISRRETLVSDPNSMLARMFGSGLSSPI